MVCLLRIEQISDCQDQGSVLVDLHGEVLIASGKFICTAVPECGELARVHVYGVPKIRWIALVCCEEVEGTSPKCTVLALVPSFG